MDSTRASARPPNRVAWARWLAGAAARRSPWFRQAARSRLLRRLGQRLLAPDAAAIAEVYAVELAAFNAQMRARGIEDIERYYWYHSVDLPADGQHPAVTTPGMYDYRQCVDAFRFPGDMRGMSVLDAGSATGYFAFEFERRGASVVCSELPSLFDLDRFPGQNIGTSLNGIHRMSAPDSSANSSGHSPQDLYHYLLEAPFQLCARLRGSRVERRFCTVYDLGPERLGRTTFDYVFAGDVLVHTLRPFDALVALARMCSGTLVIAQFMQGGPGDAPAMVYTGGAGADEDQICWWLPNEQCLKQLLQKLGFAIVTAAGNYEGIHRPAGNMFSRRIIHATRS